MEKKKRKLSTKELIFWTVALEESLESPLDCKEIQSVHPKGDQSCIFIGRTDVEAETPGFWPADVKSWLIWKDPDVGKDWRQEEKRTTEDEMVGCHHQLNGHEFEQAPGIGDGQGGLACCILWGRKSLTLNWTELNLHFENVILFCAVRTFQQSRVESEIAIKKSPDIDSNNVSERSY